jgi:hypothetical protein
VALSDVTACSGSIQCLSEIRTLAELRFERCRITSSLVRWTKLNQLEHLECLEISNSQLFPSLFKQSNLRRVKTLAVCFTKLDALQGSWERLECLTAVGTGMTVAAVCMANINAGLLEMRYGEEGRRTEQHEIDLIKQKFRCLNFTLVDFLEWTDF